MAERKPKGSGARVGLAVSLLLHLAVVTGAILSLPLLRPPPDGRSLEVSLIRLQPLAEAIRRRPTETRPSRRAAAPTLPQVQIPPAALPSPSAAQRPPAAGDDPEVRAKLTALLRGSVGCSEVQLAHLNQQELDRCEKWRRAHIDPDMALPAPIAPDKRAWYDAAIAARHTNSHPPGFVCGMLINGVHLIKPKAPPHSLQLGHLPCYVIPPKWTFSEEADIETPSRQAEAGTALTFTPQTFLTNGKPAP